MAKPLTQTEQDNLAHVIESNINNLTEEKGLVSCRMMSYEHLTPDGETFQIQVIVTRDKFDFLGPFDREDMENADVSSLTR